MKDYLTKYSRTIYLPANKINNTSIPTLSLNTPLGEDGGVLGDLIPEVEQEEVQDFTGLKMAVMKLNPKHQEVLVMYFGLGDTKEHTYKEIGQKLGITKEGVRLRINKAQNKLKELLK